MIGMRIEGATEASRALSGLPAVADAALRNAMETSLTLLEADARRLVKQDTRALMGSISHQISGSGNTLVGTVGPSLRYGFNVEYGRRPGKMPPVQALIPWVRRHGLAGRKAGDDRRVAFLIARAIGRRGIKPAPFLQPALERNRARITAIFQMVGAQVVAKMNG